MGGQCSRSSRRFAPQDDREVLRMTVDAQDNSVAFRMTVDGQDDMLFEMLKLSC